MSTHVFGSVREDTTNHGGNGFATKYTTTLGNQDKTRRQTNSYSLAIPVHRTVTGNRPTSYPALSLSGAASLKLWLPLLCLWPHLSPEFRNTSDKAVTVTPILIMLISLEFA